MNQLRYELPSDLEAAIVAFVSYYNWRPYHKALGNVALSDVLRGGRQEIPTTQEGVTGSGNRTAQAAQRAFRGLTRSPSDP